MKYILLAATLCGNLITTPTPYTLTGRIDGVKTGWVYLMHREKEKDNIDSVQIKDGQFVFAGSANAPEFCLLGVKNKEGRKEFRLGFFLDKGQLSIRGNKDSIDRAQITGSPTQDEFNSYKSGLAQLDAQEKKVEILWDSADNSKNKTLLDSVQKAYKAISAQKQQYLKAYTAAHPTSYVAAYEIYSNFSYDPDPALLQEIYGSMDPSLKTTFFGGKIKQVLDAALLTAIGQHAPDFTQNNAEGKPLSLSSLKGQYVLIDFWASWCGPCRAENPNVLKAYQKYHDKGFTVLGVSLDDKKDKWLEAVKKDQLNWYQVSDLKGWQNAVADLYGIKGIPMNFLIDKEGKVVGKGLRGEDLDKKLSELLQ